MFFSQRHNLKPLPQFQINSMNADLRVGLWNAFYCNFMSKFSLPLRDGSTYKMQVDFLYDIWIYALKRPSDEFERDAAKLVASFKHFFLTAKWYEVFDVLEYSVGKYPSEETCRGFMLECNFIFEKEISAYRFCDSIIIPIVDEAQIVTVEEEAGISLFPQPYLQPSLLLYSHQKTPGKAAKSFTG